MSPLLEGNDEVFVGLGRPSLKAIKDFGWVILDLMEINTFMFEIKRTWFLGGHG